MKTHKQYYLEIVDLWKDLCEKYALLFDLTSKEYSFLLESDIENIETICLEKKVTTDEIALLEYKRQEIISKLNTTLDDSLKIHSSSDLLKYFLNFEKEENLEHLKGFNDYLLKMTFETHKQNKKNQLFLHRAIESLREIRDEFLGSKSFPFYTSQGKSEVVTN